jgi:hypothetical protein
VKTRDLALSGRISRLFAAGARDPGTPSDAALVPPAADAVRSGREAFAPLSKSIGAPLRLVWRSGLLWDLRHDDRTVAELDLERHVVSSRTGVWLLESVSSALVARPADPHNVPVTVAYYPRRIRMGGSIVLSADQWFTLTRNPLTNTWRVVDPERNVVLRLERCRPVGARRFTPAIELSLVLCSNSSDDVTRAVTTLLAMYVVFTQASLLLTSPMI